MEILYPRRVVAAICCSVILECLAAQSSHAQARANSTKHQAKINSATPWSAAESGWSGRLVVGEYATAVYCGICQLDDDAFNSLLQHYPRTAFISLAYHVGFGLPITDRTDKYDLQQRLEEWYGRQESSIKDPGQFANGPGTNNFDGWLDGNIDLECWKENEMVGKVDAELKRPPEAFLHVQTRVDSGRIIARVKVDSVIGKHSKTYLRLVVVEDTVNLMKDGKIEQLSTGESQLPRQVQHMVVRAFAHTDKLSLGLPMKAPGTVEYTFDMAAIQARFVGYQRDGINKIVVIDSKWGPSMMTETKFQLADFPDERDWRMDPLRLHVVAFVQDANTAEVLQAVMVKLDPAQAKLLLPPKAQPVLTFRTQSDSTLANRWGYRELKD